MITLARIASLATFAVVLLIAASPASGQTSWTIETIDGPDSVGRNASLKLDRQGVPHISYYDETHADLKYATRVGQAWTIVAVDTAGFVGLSCSLALDSSGQPHIAYRSTSLGRFKYAYKQDGAWTIETVLEAEEPAGISLALDKEGNPHVAYTFFALRYASKKEGVWSTEVVYGSLFGNLQTALALTAQDEPRISYYGTGGRPYPVLSYAYKMGNVWTVEALLNNTLDGQYNSLALDSEGRPWISFRDWGAGLGILSKQDGLWRLENPYVDEDFGVFNSSIAVDANDRPYVAFYALRGAKLKLAVRSGGRWSLQDVDAERGVGRHCSLALEKARNPHIAYLDANAVDLKYAHTRLWWTPEGETAATNSNDEFVLDAMSAVPVLAADRDIVAFPNPASGPIEILYRVPVEGEIDLSVYDASGRRTRSLSTGRMPVGIQSASWDRRDDGGNKVATGIYFLRLRVGDGHEATERVTIIR